MILYDKNKPLRLGYCVNETICGDSLEVMQHFPNESFDLILTDPPYNISKLNDNRDRSKLNSPIMRRESPLKYDFGEWDNKTRDEFLEFTTKWLKESCRVLKDGGTFISFLTKKILVFWVGKQRSAD